MIGMNTTTFAYGLALALILGLAAGAASIWYVRGLQIDSIKSKHATELAVQELKVSKAENEASTLRLDFEKNLEDKRNELNKTYADLVSDVNTTVGRLASIRLQDPHRDSNSGATNGKGSAEGDNGSGSSSGGLLSLQTSQFLWSFAGESDVYLGRLRQCREWNKEVTIQSQKYYDEIIELRKKVK